MQYCATWPSLCASYEDSNGRMMGYVLGKAEGNEKLWHGHVTCVTVSPEFRRLGLARMLMAYLEDVSQRMYNAYFIDLFVRLSNNLAQVMYTQLGYINYRQVILYYSGEEDAYDMRKALPRDGIGEKDGGAVNTSVIPRMPFKCHPHEIEWH